MAGICQMHIRRLRNGAAAAAALLAVVSVPAAAEPPDLSGIYWATEYHAKIAVVGGGELPLTDAGKAAYEANVAGLKDGGAPPFSLADRASALLLQPCGRQRKS